MKVWGITDKGISRQENQDAYFSGLYNNDSIAVCVVCDGMGGARAGNVASAVAIDGFMEEIIKALEREGGTADLPGLSGRAAAYANRVVYEKSMVDANYSGMGTTLCAALVDLNSAAVVNVGDSRAYHIAKKGIQRITRDHSVVEELVSNGDITREEAQIHPKRNLITRALGLDEDVAYDVFCPEIKKGEYFLLCSDGLTNIVSESEIFDCVRAHEGEDACRKLMEIALSRGAPDNVTIVLFEQ